jgi:hypothetical protein
MSPRDAIVDFLGSAAAAGKRVPLKGQGGFLTLVRRAITTLASHLPTPTWTNPLAPRSPGS